MRGTYPQLLAIAALSILFVGGINTVTYADLGANLKIFTGSGAYKISQTEAFFKPFEKQTGTKIEVRSGPNPLELLKNWNKDIKAKGDVINLTSYEAQEACDAGYLMTFNAQDISLDAKETPITQDFLANSLFDCAIPTVAWSALMVVKQSKFKKAKPRVWADFFNPKKFSGKRSLKKSAQHTLEMAIMADGVPANEVYEVLSTIEGQKRAFAQLDKIKDLITWWETGDQSIKNLSQDDVSIGTAYNGRLFNAMIGDGLDVTLVWQGQIYDYDYWGIPHNTPHRDQAVAFVKFATSPQQLAAQSSWMPYGPMRTSSLSFVKEHSIGKMHMAPYLPTTKAHFIKALKFQERWWRSNDGLEAQKRFTNWLQGSLVWPDKK